MSKVHTPSSINAARRWREVRDVFQKLRKKHRTDIVIEFIERNYFITRVNIYWILSKVDDAPVENPSITYTTVMNENFNL